MTTGKRGAKRIATLRAHRLTFMVVPERAGSIVSWRLSAFWGLVLAASIGLLLIGAVASYFWAGHLGATVVEQRATIDTLTKEGEELREHLAEHAARVYELEQAAAEVAELLAHLQSLEEEIRQVVPGSRADASPANQGAALASVSGEGDLASALDEEWTGIGGGEPWGAQELSAEVSARLEHLREAFAERSKDLDHLRATLEAHNHRLNHTPIGWPTQGRVTSNFGRRRHPITGSIQNHNGIDIAAPTGTPVRATAAGTVILAGNHGGYGRAVIIDHGYQTRTLYGHNSRLLVRVGQKVERGDIIAEVGSTGQSTGPHVHYEVLVRGRPVDPAPYINGPQR